MNIHKPIENLIDAWRKTDSLEAFLSNLPKIGKVDPYKFCSLVLLSSENFIDSLNKKVNFSHGSKVEEEKSDSALYYLSKFIGKEREKIEGRVILFKEKLGIYFLFTISERDFIDKCLKRFIANSYPVVFQPVIKQNDLKKILSELEEKFIPNAIRITKSSAKRWTISEGPYERKKQISSRLDWESMTVKDTFREAAEEGKWFTKLTFRIFEIKMDSLTDTYYNSSINKRGMFLTNGWLPQYSEIVIPSFLSIAENKMSLYKDRSRSETASHEIRPLVVKFTESVFVDQRSNRKFINTLEKIPHFGYSVIHSNPYIHMSLLDYRDGSSFEILVHEPDKIMILPQIRASSISLEHIVSHIAERFNEGEVIDLKDV